MNLKTMSDEAKLEMLIEMEMAYVLVVTRAVAEMASGLRPSGFSIGLMAVTQKHIEGVMDIAGCSE